MTTPRYRDVRDDVLDTDDMLLERARSLLQGGVRRQLWLMFLDDQQRQLPLLLPVDIPRRPGARESTGFGRFVGEIVDDVDAASVVVTLERRGSGLVSKADAEWLRLARDSCAAAGVPMRGPMLCHTGGVRWVAADDYAIG